MQFCEPCRNTERACFRPISTKNDGLRLKWLKTKYIQIRKCGLHSSDIYTHASTLFLCTSANAYVTISLLSQKKESTEFPISHHQCRDLCQASLTCMLLELLRYIAEPFVSQLLQQYKLMLKFHRYFKYKKTFISPAKVFYSVTMYSTKDVVL